MRTRIAVISMLVGLVLLATGLVRYVTARDVQGLDPTAPLRGSSGIVVLLAAGAALIVGGVGALARWSRPAWMLLAGAVLLGAAGLLYLFAREARRQEQAILDRRWTEEARRATRQSPPALPGGRPAPAPLRGLPVVLGLAAGGVVLAGAGLAALGHEPGLPRHPPQEGHE